MVDEDETRAPRRAYTPEEIRDQIVDALTSKAVLWEGEAAAEGLKGAASQTRIYLLQWGVSQIREMTKYIVAMEMGVSETLEPSPATGTSPLDSETTPIDSSAWDGSNTANTRVMLDRDKGIYEVLQSPYPLF